MTKPTGKPRGRPRVPAAEQAIVKTFSIPADLWELVDQHLPERGRSAIIQQAFEAELAARGIALPARLRKDAAPDQT